MDYEYFTIERLAELPYRELRELFKELDVPTPEEMNGEYVSRYPVAFEKERQLWIESNRGGHWFGKSYCTQPIGKYQGQGYNLYEDKKNNRCRRCLRFGWEIADSSIDGKKSLIMHYNLFIRPGGPMSLTDEIRRVRKGLYVGFYYNTDRISPPFNFGWDYENSHTKPEFFFLLGPIHSWEGPDEQSMQEEILNEQVNADPIKSDSINEEERQHI